MSDVIAAALIGEEARKFVESDLGQKVLLMAREQTESAQEALESVDPEDPKLIRELQNKAKLGRMFNDYLVELISKGEQSIAVFRQEETDES